MNKQRIPKELFSRAKLGQYKRTFPYPIEDICSAFQGKPFITQESNIITMGSCFAQEVRKWLLKNNFNTPEHEWGVIYTPKSIEQIVKYSLHPAQWQPKELYWEMYGQFFLPIHKRG